MIQRLLLRIGDGMVRRRGDISVGSLGCEVPVGPPVAS